MARLLEIVILMVVLVTKAEDDLNDFVFSDPDEVMIAQESRQYQTVVQPPVRIVKPTGVTNSHRPQFNLDSYEDLSPEILEDLDTTLRQSLVKMYKSSDSLRAKESMIKDAVLRAFERKDHVGKFAQILPIIRAMSGNQRVALASLVASQVSTPPGRAPLNLVQVSSMFGNNDNTTELMLPILLDMANLFRRALRSKKEPREVKLLYQPAPQQLLRRSDTEDIELDDEPFDTTLDQTTINSRRLTERKQIQTFNRNIQNESRLRQIRNKINPKPNQNSTMISSTTTESTDSSNKNSTTSRLDNETLDLAADATNQTSVQDLPFAEKLRTSNRYTDRKVSAFRRGIYTPKLQTQITRRTTTEAPPLPQSIVRRRPALLGQTPAKRKLPISSSDGNKCELFTNTLCLNSDDYPTDAIVQSIRRNKAAAAALLADYREPAEGVIDGVTAAQEAKYNEQHYLVSNRRGDTANRDFASAGEAGFMCPSTVKYARPQRARATSGQWKYIVNTGEHTQTLRLEKCLKPKEACTYLTDNFKSKCVQVYNYHRLLTWDQQNGLHMDIFKVPTCCSCHIEGYSVSFPPLGHRLHETSSEHFPGEDLSAEQGNHAFENVQSSILKPKIKAPPFNYNKPIDSLSPYSDNKKPLESILPFSDTQNIISGSPFSKNHDNDDNLPSNPIDSYGNTYFPDSFNQASNVRHMKRPVTARNPSQNFEEVTLPSFLEPPMLAATTSFNFVKDTSTKYKNAGNHFKRGQSRPNQINRRPIRKKISGGLTEDLVSSGSQAVESFPNGNIESLDDENDYEDTDIGQATIISKTPKPRITISPKLHAMTTEKEETNHENKYSSTIKENNYESNGGRINYNYHPIIDFFEEDKEFETDENIDREDNEKSYDPVLQSEWKPIDSPASRTSQMDADIRKKHK